jgi:hypothetical protein
VYTCFQDGEGNSDPTDSERKNTTDNDTVALDEWNHIVITWEQPGTHIVYVNGVNVYSNSLRAPTTKVADRHMIGKAPNSGSRGLRGWVDDVAVWDRVLSLQEVQALYNAGIGTNPLSFVATNISPVDGTVDTPREKGVPIDAEFVELQWGPPVPASAITDPTYVAVIGEVDPNANPDHPSVQRIDVGTAMTAKPATDLNPDTTYYWMVEVTGIDSNDISVMVKSEIWSFQTESEGPYIVSDPSVQVVAAGDDAVFVAGASAIQPEAYQWYKADAGGDVEIPGANSSTLLVENAQKSDNGAYYCKITNSVREAETASANLAIREMWAHYRFENDTLDETGLGHHAELRVNDPNTEDGIDPLLATYIAGKVGNGLLFNGVDQWAYIGTDNPSELSGQISASAWVLWNGYKVEDPWQNLLSKRSASDIEQAMWQVQLHPNDLGRTRFTVGGGGSILYGEPVPGPEGIERTEDGIATASAEDIEAGQGVANLFDNAEGADSKWQTGPSYGPAENATGWAIYDFKGEDAYAITSYAVTVANNNADRDPIAWTLEGSNDGELWDVLDSRSDIVWPDRDETLSFTIGAPASYMMYKFNVASNNGHANRMQVAELQLFEAVSEDESWAHIAATFDGQTAVLYINGVEVSRDEDYALGMGFAANLGIATGNMNDEDSGDFGDLPSLPWATGLLNGALDEIRIHNYALDRYEVAQIVANDSGEAVLPEYHPYDADRSGVIDLPDLAALLLEWASCDIVPDCIP